MNRTPGDPPEHVWAVIDHDGTPRTESPSGRWAFKTPHHAANRAHLDRVRLPLGSPRTIRVARYRFDGWL